MDWKKAERQPEDGRVAIPDNWLFLHYYEGLSSLFKIENTLRVFVYIVLRRQHGRKWQDLALESDDQTKTTIQALAKRRIAQAEVCGYLGFRSHSPLLYLTSGELLRLILADSYWPDFKKFFPADKNVVALKLQEIGLVRNSLAHFRPVSSEDIAVIQQNARQILSIVEQTVADIFFCEHQVPANSSEPWFAPLAQLGRKGLRVAATQSASREWIRLALVYDSPILSRPTELHKYTLQFSGLAPDAIRALDSLQPIRDLIVFASETINSSIKSVEAITLRKVLRYTFHRAALTEHHQRVIAALETIVQAVEEDEALLQDNQLAEGRILRIVRLTAPHTTFGERSYWPVRTEPATTPLSADAVEFVGSSGVDRQNALSDTTRFPWMPVDISSDEIPF